MIGMRICCVISLDWKNSWSWKPLFIRRTMRIQLVAFYPGEWKARTGRAADRKPTSNMTIPSLQRRVPIFLAAIGMRCAIAKKSPYAQK